MASDNTTVVVAVHAENNGTNSEAVPDFSLIEGHISHMNCSSSSNVQPETQRTEWHRIYSEACMTYLYCLGPTKLHGLRKTSNLPLLFHVFSFRSM